MSVYAPLIDVSLDEFDANGMQTRFAISPFGASETRQERLARWQAEGMYDPDCRHCQAARDSPSLAIPGPTHRINPRCKSGGRPHCTCDACF
jgi:hypothetical protein